MGKRDRASQSHDAATSELLRLPPNNNSFNQQQTSSDALEAGDKASRKAARKALKAAKKRAADSDTAAAAMSDPVDDNHNRAPHMEAQGMPPKKKARKAVEVSPPPAPIAARLLRLTCFPLVSR